MPALWTLLAGLLLLPATDIPRAAAATSSVRAASPDMRLAIDHALAESAIVRALVARLACTDTIVYVESTASPQIPLARTKLVTAAPGIRFLRIGVNASISGAAFTPLLAHELQHAIEIAEREDVRDDAAVRRLYRAIGRADGDDRFETDVAVRVEAAVRRELRGRTP